MLPRSSRRGRGNDFAKKTVAQARGSEFSDKVLVEGLCFQKLYRKPRTNKVCDQPFHSLGRLLTPA